MALKEDEVQKIINFVKKEPRAVQDVATYLGRSWVTADTYLRQVKERTGVLDIKTFRKGTQGALKIAFYLHPDAPALEDIQKKLYLRILNGRWKEDFDFMEVFQFIPEDKKDCCVDLAKEELSVKRENILRLMNHAKHTFYIFSGNMSFVKDKEIVTALEKLLQRKVQVKVLCRINLAFLNNLALIDHLLQKYPHNFEVRHAFQPLRGFLVDDILAKFRTEEKVQRYRSGELAKNMRINYEFTDKEFITWLQRVFWNLFRSSIDHKVRVKELKKLV